jgi:tRNA A37 methylthiotransferase MiaB
VREIMLLGQIVDRYGVDFDDGTDLSHLLRAVAGWRHVSACAS